jgi:hypothetical protein
MTITVANIDIGDLPNDGTGDPLRTAFEKINLNFRELNELGPSGPNGSFQFNNDGLPLGTSSFSYTIANNSITLGANIIPTGTVDIGTEDDRINKIFLKNAGVTIGNLTISENNNNFKVSLLTNPNQLGNLEVNRLVTQGDMSTQGTLTVGNLLSGTVTATTNTNNPNQIVFQTPAVPFKYGEFKITSLESNSLNSQTVVLTINKNQNNNSVNFCAYGTIFTGNVVTDYNSSIAFGNVRVQVSPFVNTIIEHTISYKITT